MYRYHRGLYVLILVLLLGSRWGTVDAAERRLALVIGNGAYTEAPLHNPIHDATDMAAALTQMGFEVITLTNARLREMTDAAETFSRQLHRSEVGLFYYAGHGMQVAGENYLVPIGARINREQDVPFETFHVGRLLGIMEAAGNALNLILLDACRTNPFARSVRSGQHGLAMVQGTPGSLIAYATAPGAVAADGEGRNGTYTKHLLQSMRTPGLPVEEVFKQVRINVRQETRHAQTPWEVSSLTRSFSFVPGGTVAQTPPPLPLTSSTPQPVGASTSRPPLAAPEVPQSQPPSGRLVVSANGTVLDTTTKLMWMSKDFRLLESREPRGWEEAMAWSEQINTQRYGGYGDWRTPTVEEYQSLHEAMQATRAQSGRAIGSPEVFVSGGDAWYWSKEIHQMRSANPKLTTLYGYHFRGGHISIRAITDIRGDESVRLVRDGR